LPAGPPAGDLARDLGPEAHELARLLREMAALAPVPTDGQQPPTPTVDPEQEKRRLVDALAQFLVGLAATGPLLLVVEDLHWSDDTSLDFLLSLARRLAARPILLLRTDRDDEVHAGLRHFLAGLDRERRATELTLARLPLADVESLVQASFSDWQAVPADL